RSAAMLGAALLAFDGLAVTMSRIAMLDIFLQFFVLLGVLAILIDRDRMWRGTPAHPPIDDTGAGHRALPRLSRRWLWLAGLFLGLAVATKWSGLAPLGLAWAWVLASELWWRRRWTGGWTTDLPRAIARGFLALVAVPVLIYLISYVGWFANLEHTRKADRCTVVPDTTEELAETPALPAGATGEGCEGLEAFRQVAEGWWEEQGEIFRFHRGLEAEHPYRAPATTWVLMTRPVAYYYESCASTREDRSEPCEVAEDHVAEVLGIGNPAMWWSALIGYPWLLWFAVRRRSWPAITIVLFLFGQALPYLLSPRPVFLFYMTPAVPFIGLSLAYLADRALDSETMRWVPALITVVSLVGFAFWAPLFLGLEISSQLWDTLIFLPEWV
ncbi:MAG TPA: phospholipid carrier-dependent glycosyltransferase, partial [Euzebya sp.]|nr:phospholipid carrier-dependent glycosyltransferase [Euzebya sp.]